MRIHTNIEDSPIGVTHPVVFRDAANMAGVQIERISCHGSRSRARAFDFLLSGNGVTGGQWGNSGVNGAGPYKAATWDEWGIFLGHLFSVDPDARVPRVYEGAEHYHWSTNDRFNPDSMSGILSPRDQHLRHKWDRYDRSITGAYMINGCKCGAIRRYMAFRGFREHPRLTT